MAAPFLTRLESCHDPQVLWPLVAGLSVLAHGALLLSLQPWVKVASTPEPASVIPVQLLPLTANPNASPGLAPAPASESALPPAPEPSPALSPATPPQAEVAPSLAPDPTPRPSLPAKPLSPESPPPPTSASPPPPTSAPPTPTPQGTPPSRDTPSAVSPPPTVTPSPATTTPPTVAPPAVTPPTATPPPTAPPPPAVAPTPAAPNPTPPQGQLFPQGLRPTPYGRDWPDTPPQLLSTASIALAPWLVGCGVADLGAIAAHGTTVHISLRVRVEADGTVSAAYVDSSSGYPALDNLVSCIGQRQLRLAPALVDGQPHVTDAYQVDIQVQL